MINGDILIDDFFKSGNKSFGQGVDYLISKGFDKQKSEEIVKKNFAKSSKNYLKWCKSVLGDDYDEDVEIEIPIKKHS